MNNWPFYVRLDEINGAAITLYEVIDFPLCDELYEKITKAVELGEPLKKCDFIDEVYKVVEEQLDIEGILKERAGDEYIPEEEEDEEADYCSPFGHEEDYSIDSVRIYDPGDNKRLNERFSGLCFSEYAGQDNKSFSVFDDNWCITHNFTLNFDENGVLKDITNVYSEGDEYGSERYTQTGECYPNYNFIAKYIEELFEEMQQLYGAMGIITHAGWCERTINFALPDY